MEPVESVQLWDCIPFCLHFIVCSLWSVYLCAVFLWYSKKSNFNESIFNRVNQKKIKSSLKKYMSCEWTLNLDQWKAFAKDFKPIRVWLWLVYNTTKNNCYFWLFKEFIQTQKVILPILAKLIFKCEDYLP